VYLLGRKNEGRRQCFVIQLATFFIVIKARKKIILRLEIVNQGVRNSTMIDKASFSIYNSF
jgi:hypothetical protein